MNFKHAGSGIPEPITEYRDSHCDVHGDFREMGGSLTGRADAIRWFGCSDCNRAQRERETEEVRAEEEAKRQKRLEDRINAAGVPAAFRGRTFQSYVIESDEMQHAYDVAFDFASNFWTSAAKEGKCLVFGGHTGTGKSHLALSVAQHVLRRGTAFYADAYELIRLIRSTWRPGSSRSEEEVMNSIVCMDLLVIDEVGVQRGSNDEMTTLTDIINRRYRDMRATILLTNQDGGDFDALMGPRIMSRLTERATFVTFDWADWRLRGAQ